MHESFVVAEEPLRTSLSLSSEAGYTSSHVRGACAIADHQSEMLQYFGYDSDNSEYNIAVVPGTDLEGNRIETVDTEKSPESRSPTPKRPDVFDEKYDSMSKQYHLFHPESIAMQEDDSVVRSFTDFFDEPDDLAPLLKELPPLVHIGVDEKNTSDPGDRPNSLQHEESGFYVSSDQMLYQQEFDTSTICHAHAFSDSFGQYNTQVVGNEVASNSWIPEPNGRDLYDKTLMNGEFHGSRLETDVGFYNLDAQVSFYDDQRLFDEIEQSVDNDSVVLDLLSLKNIDQDTLNYAFNDSCHQEVNNGIQDFEIETPVLGYELSCTNIDMRSNSFENRRRIVPEPRGVGKRYIKSSVYKWMQNELDTVVSLNDMHLDIKRLDPVKVSNSVKRTIEKELRLQDQYLAALMQGRRTLHLMKPRRRRNPICDDLTWIPVSLYQAAYTNIKIHPLEKTDYSNEIPSELCFGKVNMRVKRAWLRRPNKQKLVMIDGVLQSALNMGTDVDFDPNDDVECNDYFLFHMQ